MTARPWQSTLALTAISGAFVGMALATLQPASSAPAASTAAQVKALQKQVTALTAQVNALKKSKADGSQLSTVASAVYIATTSVEGLSQAATSMQVGLSALQASMSGVTKVLELKANAADLSLKADKDTVQALAVKVAALCSAQPAACQTP